MMVMQPRPKRYREVVAESGAVVTVREVSDGSIQVSSIGNPVLGPGRVAKLVEALLFVSTGKTRAQFEREGAE